MKKIGIMTALDAEGKKLEDYLGKPLKTDLYGHISVKTYIYKDKEIYFAKSGVGEIFASACTEILIAIYKAEAIINYGFAGGYNNRKIGESVLIGGVVHYDFDISKVDDCKPGHYLGLFDSPVIRTDEGLLNFVKSLDDNLSIGLLASGDKFVADEDFKKNLYTAYGTDVYDMEGAAILIVCRNANIPVVIVKVVSDNGNADEYYSFKELVRDTKIKFVDLLRKIVDNI